MQYTVIGLDATGVIYCQHIEAPNEGAAMRLAAVDAFQNNTEYDLDILGAIKGAHTMVTACEDSGKDAMAVDLLPDNEEEVQRLDPAEDSHDRP